MAQPALAAMVTAYVPMPAKAGLRYGYGWAVGRKFDRRWIGHGGGGAGFGFNSIIDCYPDDHVVIIVLSNQDGRNVAAISERLARMLFEGT